MRFDALVIGGGVHGLAALYHLGRLGHRRLGLLEQFAVGHERGSSHGPSRVTRSTYADVGYVRLAARARAEAWPQLEADTATQLVMPAAGCFFGPPGGRFDEYVRTVVAAGVDVEELGAAAARDRFPLFRFDGVRVLHDRTAGLIASARTLAVLRRAVQRRGAQLIERTRVTSIVLGRDPIVVGTTAGDFETERLVVTVGPWVSALLRWLSPLVTVARQTVAYFAVESAPALTGVERFPVWAYIGDGDNDIYYGLPEFEQPGLKVARHVTLGRDDDPDAPHGTDPAAVDDLRAFLGRHLRVPIHRLCGQDTCFYTNTATEDFIIDTHPEDVRVAIGAGFSGHGFKFAPLTGRILAEMVTNEGRTSVAEFEAMRAQFSIAARAPVH